MPHAQSYVTRAHNTLRRGSGCCGAKVRGSHCPGNVSAARSGRPASTAASVSGSSGRRPGHREAFVGGLVPRRHAPGVPRPTPVRWCRPGTLQRPRRPITPRAIPRHLRRSPHRTRASRWLRYRAVGCSRACASSTCRHLDVACTAGGDMGHPRACGSGGGAWWLHAPSCGVGAAASTRSGALACGAAACATATPAGACGATTCHVGEWCWLRRWCWCWRFCSDSSWQRAPRLPTTAATRRRTAGGACVGASGSGRTSQWRRWTRLRR